ncbi:hypothetical protein [Paracidovorax avenae]|uniref:hypothetical protein n=1 Tax=Paracidovorax avenae TaxID=80867 RepID=UPI001AD7EBF0|nr:hypothetical protein [Paracidovorax avenae]
MSKKLCTLAGFATEIAAVPEGIVVGVGGEGGRREEFLLRVALVIKAGVEFKASLI